MAETERTSDVKRFRRWLPLTLAALSLILCLASISLWTRSYRTSDWIEWVYGRHFYAASTARGAIAVTYSYVTNADHPHFALESVDWPDMNSVYQSKYRRTFWNALGFRYDDSARVVYREADGSDSSGGNYRLQVPLYFLILLFAVAPLGYAVRFWMCRAFKSEVCAFDVVTTPRQGR